MQIITGKAGQNHVTSDQFRRIVESLTGDGGSFTPSVKNGLTATLGSGNTVHLESGILIHHGCVFDCTGTDAEDTITLVDCGEGNKRIDLIVCRYTNTNGIETASIVTVTGTEVASGEPTAPTSDYQNNDLRNGDANDDCVMYQVHFEGNNRTLVKIAKDMPIKSIHEYSSSEKVVGTWIDGRTIFRKVINFGSLPNATTKLVPHGITNLSFITNLHGIAKNNETFITLPYTTPTNVSTNTIELCVQSGNVFIKSGSNRTGYTQCYVVVEYVKTVN